MGYSACVGPDMSDEFKIRKLECSSVFGDLDLLLGDHVAEIHGIVPETRCSLSAPSLTFPFSLFLHN